MRGVETRIQEIRHRICRKFYFTIIHYKHKEELS